jgi:cytoskeletal protein CcmA (bactofilin family)
VRLYGTAHVDGDITHEQLSMETGAFFQGRSVKFQRQAHAFTESMSKTVEKVEA